MSTALSVFAADAAKEYATYDCELTFRDRLLGGLPSDPHLMRGWLVRSATKAAQKDAGANKQEIRDAIIRKDMIETIAKLGYDTAELKDIEDLNALEERAIEKMGEQKLTRFARMPEGKLALEGRNVKAMLKESAAITYPSTFFSKETGNALETQNTRTGKGLKSFIAERVFPEPALIVLDRTEPDDVQLKIGHTPNGASIGLHEAVDEIIASFQVLVWQDMISPEVWAKIWTHAEHNGLGACRSMGYGTFSVTRWEKIATKKPTARRRRT